MKGFFILTRRHEGTKERMAHFACLFVPSCLRVSFSLFVLLAWLLSTPLFAGESSLTRTFQPLDGLASGEIEIAPVICHDWYAFSGFPTATALIAAKNIPPTNAPKPVADINVVSLCGIAIQVEEKMLEKWIVVLDFRALKVPQSIGCTELQAVCSTLECLRLVAGKKLDEIELRPLLKPTGQEKIQEQIKAFLKHPKDKEFPWKEPEKILTPTTHPL
jgi:hypothetical protein